MPIDDEITVISREYDQRIRRTWKAKLVKDEPPLIELVGQFDRDVEHSNLGFIERGTVSYEYYWLDRWYNVFRFHTPAGQLRNYYCNINLPPKFEEGVLDYIDLDVDLLLWPDGAREVLDREDFKLNASKYCYSAELHNGVEKALNELMSLIDAQEFPFEII
jgi:protein associated with RNAse G/E